MLESLAVFLNREANDDAGRLALIRWLAPRVVIARGFDLNGLGELSLLAYGEHYLGGNHAEYVGGRQGELVNGGKLGDTDLDANEVAFIGGIMRAADLECIAVRPFKSEGHEGTPDVLVRAACVHLRGLHSGVEHALDRDDLLRHVYIQPEHVKAWRAAADHWRSSRGPDAPATGSPPSSGNDLIKRNALVQKYRHAWGSIENDMKTKRESSLSHAAKAQKNGWWHEKLAVEWATQRGKLRAADISASPFPGTIHRII